MSVLAYHPDLSIDRSISHTGSARSGVLRNLVELLGRVLLVANGAGAWSLDARRAG